jgi:hypothetical protein
MLLYISAVFVFTFAASINVKLFVAAYVAVF